MEKKFRMYLKKGSLDTFSHHGLFFLIQPPFIQRSSTIIGWVSLKRISKAYRISSQLLSMMFIALFLAQCSQYQLVKHLASVSTASFPVHYADLCSGQCSLSPKCVLHPLQHMEIYSFLQAQHKCLNTADPSPQMT